MIDKKCYCHHDRINDKIIDAVRGWVFFLVFYLKCLREHRGRIKAGMAKRLST